MELLRYLVCVSTACMPLIERFGRTFKLTDSSSEHCPPGEFVREVSLPTRIPEDAKLEAYYDMTQTVLEILVPKHRVEPEEHEKRESFQSLAPLLWNSFGVLAIFLQELTSVYPLLSPPNLTMAASNRVCSVLALLQCVAADPNTKKAFMDAYIPFYLDPFVGTTSQERPFEHLRLSSLGIIGAMVKEHDPKVISFLLDTGIISLCLRGMEIGSELSKTVAIFIVQKIISDDVGLIYICSKPEQFYSLSDHLRSVVEYLSQQQQPSQRMLTHILRCYLRLTDDPRACTKLQTCLPGALTDASLGSNINDEATTSLLQELLRKVYG